MDGSQVWQAYQEGKLPEIRDYCETDVANTYLVYQRFGLIGGRLSQTEYQYEINLLRQWLNNKNDKTHWQEFLKAWS